MGYIRVYRGGDLIDQMEVGRHPLTIGRSEDNRLTLADTGVSRRHAIIFREQGAWFVQDLDSSNGVFVNKKRVTREKLRYWDEIQIHQFVIRFMATAAAGGAHAGNLPGAAVDEEDRTRFANLQTVQDLDKLRDARREAWVSMAGTGGETTRHVIRGSRLSIGSSKQADIRIPGWFGPAEAAHIERIASSFRLVPHRRGRVSVDGESLLEPALIEDGTRFSARGREFTFYHRTPG